MRTRDFLKLSVGAVIGAPTRSFLTALGIAVGIAAVVLLTSIGEGIHRYVLAEFTQFGTNLIAINPGKATTHGASTGVFGSVRPLTIEDANALARIPYVRAVVPAVQGNAEVEAGERRRRTTVYGVTSEFPTAFSMRVSSGRFLPPDDPTAARAYAVLGAKVRSELFGAESPLGARIRAGGERYTVIGVMEPKGQVLGVDLDDSLYVPAARALQMFNRDSLMEIDVVTREGAPVAEVVERVKRVLSGRHGREDFTVTTQQQMLEVLGSVLDVLTFSVGALGGISLFVGGIGILTIMTISVTERTGEIGLLRALGAKRGHVLALFMGEAVALASLGGLAGLGLGVGGAQLLHFAVPGLPVHTPWSYAIAAELLAAVIGLAAGVLPARRAALLDPVVALRAE